MVTPPHPKMVVCICRANGLYLRINSGGTWPGSIPLPKKPMHSFLHHDSFIECGNLIELDDYIVEDAHVIGRVDAALIPAILSAIDDSVNLRRGDKDAVRAALLPLVPK